MFNTRNKSGISARPCIILYINYPTIKMELITFLSSYIHTVEVTSHVNIQSCEFGSDDINNVGQICLL